MPTAHSSPYCCVVWKTGVPKTRKTAVCSSAAVAADRLPFVFCRVFSVVGINFREKEKRILDNILSQGGTGNSTGYDKRIRPSGVNGKHTRGCGGAARSLGLSSSAAQTKSQYLESCGPNKPTIP